jgi:hypothetical protein
MALATFEQIRRDTRDVAALLEENAHPYNPVFTIPFSRRQVMLGARNLFTTVAFCVQLCATSTRMAPDRVCRKTLLPSPTSWRLTWWASSL